MSERNTPPHVGAVEEPSGPKRAMARVSTWWDGIPAIAKKVGVIATIVSTLSMVGGFWWATKTELRAATSELRDQMEGRDAEHQRAANNVAVTNAGVQATVNQLREEFREMRAEQKEVRDEVIRMRVNMARYFRGGERER